MSINAVVRSLLLMVAFTSGCARPAPAPRDPVIGAWGDDHHVFQFFEDRSCTLLGQDFNVAGKYSTVKGQIRLSEARMQYDAPGFRKLPSANVELTMQHDYELRLSGGFLPETLHLIELTPDQVKRKVAEISEAHREAVRRGKASKQPAATKS